MDTSCALQHWKVNSVTTLDKINPVAFVNPPPKLGHWSIGYELRTQNVFHVNLNCYTLNYKTRSEWLFGKLSEEGPRCLSRYSDSLRAGRSGDRILMGARFSTPDRTGPGAHPASYTMGTGSFPGVKRPGRGVDHQSHLAPRLRKE